jgi:hypothetical protein
VRYPALKEASGLAASRRFPGLYYTHNDSGDVARVFVLDRQGQIRAVIALDGITAVDCEDIAMAPGADPNSGDVCLADTGDNDRQRADVVIYRFPEPDLPAATTQPAELHVSPTAYHVQYAGGPQNVEAVAVHPQTGDGYLLAKHENADPAEVFVLKAPWSATQVNVLATRAKLTVPGVLPLARALTAADISPDGQRIAVRTYSGGWEWTLPPGTSDFVQIFDTPPARLVLADEPQGEGLCYAVDGRALLTISEKWPTFLNEVRRSDEPPTQPVGSTPPTQPAEGTPPADGAAPG